MDQRYSIVEHVVTVERSREISYLGHIVFTGSPPGKRYDWVPNITIYEDENDLVILLELAGVRSDEISLTLEQNRLIVRGRRNILNRRPALSYHHIEIPTGVFEKVLRFRCSIDKECIKSVMKEGLMEIRVAKTDLARVE